MKRLITLLTLSIFLVACAQAAPSPTSLPGTVLVVTDGEGEKTYTVEDLQALTAAQATFRDVTYIGVPLATLLDDAGFDPQGIAAVKAEATDGFSANYDPALITKEDTLVAYARLDGPLADDEGRFRMVLPDQGGSLNVRFLFKIQIIP